MGTKNKMSSEAWKKLKKKSSRVVEYIPIKWSAPNTRKERREAEREAKRNAKV